MKRCQIVFLALISLGGLVASGPGFTQVAASASATHFMAGEIMIDRPWSPATPRGARTAAAYMTIMNHGTSPEVLLGGSSPVAERLELHQRSVANGVISMRALPDGLVIPAGGTVTLGPQASHHVMLSGLKGPLVEGTRVPATLNFAKAGTVHVELEVAAIGARAPGANHANPDAHRHP